MDRINILNSAFGMSVALWPHLWLPCIVRFDSFNKFQDYRNLDIKMEEKNDVMIHNYDFKML